MKSISLFILVNFLFTFAIADDAEKLVCSGYHGDLNIHQAIVYSTSDRGLSKIELQNGIYLTGALEYACSLLCNAVTTVAVGVDGALNIERTVNEDDMDFRSVSISGRAGGLPYSFRCNIQTKTAS